MRITAPGQPPAGRGLHFRPRDPRRSGFPQVLRGRATVCTYRQCAAPEGGKGWLVYPTQEPMVSSLARRRSTPPGWRPHRRVDTIRSAGIAAGRQSTGRTKVSSSDSAGRSPTSSLWRSGGGGRPSKSAATPLGEQPPQEGHLPQLELQADSVAAEVADHLFSQSTALPRDCARSFA
jgi:hypothetical protein